MPTYPSAGALLGDARLRLDALDTDAGILVVEGPDDVRLFHPRLKSVQQVIVSGGRTLLLAAYQETTDADRERIVFVTDCDFEVELGTLSPAPSLVITKNADAEADLLELGLLKRLVIELVQAALTSDEDADRIVQQVVERAAPYAEVIGQVRRIAKMHGKEIDVDDVKYIRLRKRRSTVVDELELVIRLGQQLDFCGMSREQFCEKVTEFPRGFRHMNGKDLVNAVHFVLRVDYGCRDDREAIAKMLRMAAGEFFEDWTVAKDPRRNNVDSLRRVARVDGVVPFAVELVAGEG
jgi:hypothetical protein